MAHFDRSPLCYPWHTMIGSIGTCWSKGTSTETRSGSLHYPTTTNSKIYFEKVGTNSKSSIRYVLALLGVKSSRFTDSGIIVRLTMGQVHIRYWPRIRYILSLGHPPTPYTQRGRVDIDPYHPRYRPILAVWYKPAGSAVEKHYQRETMLTSQGKLL